ncbi:5' exonuclease Apollo-like [Ylistrum balloti]|uniref:5' exonuclease Apollo-like n=1 Tax=Ylistrum balloti TaxID=509963 RepID=UPI002905D85B|nr:5' exonuclease Apollo-like [Ylistrum balloti]
MNGTVIQGTPIAVDFWKIRECPSSKLFFLTHLHGDHIVGLSSSWRHTIHCSPMTGELLTQLYGIEESLVRPLEVGTSHILDLDDVDCEKMLVTVFDANHCPGSVMYLFEGYFGRILHTGDFRLCDNMMSQSNRALFNDIDLLYLDNTYCSPNCVFPSRDIALNEILSIINSHPHHTVVVGMRNLGKEDMLANIALKCKEWISIPATMEQRVNLLKLPNVFVVDDESCRIRVVKFQAVSKKNIDTWNKVTPTIAILPTALYQGLGFNSCNNKTNIFTVQYSDHSSFQELHKFVSTVKPHKIIPIVKANSRGPFGVDISDRSNMGCFSHLLNKKDRIGIVLDIPESVQKWMYNVSSNYGNLRKRRNAKVLKARQKKKSVSQARGVVFSDGDEDVCFTTVTLENIDNENREKNGSEMLKNNDYSISPLSKKQKTELENRQPQVKNTLLDKWLSVSDMQKDVTKKDRSHPRYRPLLFKKSKGNSFSSETQSRGNKTLITLDTCSSHLSTNSDQETTNNTPINLKEEKNSDVEDVIILDDTSSDGTSTSLRRGDNSTTDYINFVDDSVDVMKTKQENHRKSLCSESSEEDNKKSDQSCFHKPEPFVKKPCRQSSEPKFQMKFSVKPLTCGRKKMSKAKFSSISAAGDSKDNVVFSVMPLCQGR